MIHLSNIPRQHGSQVLFRLAPLRRHAARDRPVSFNMEIALKRTYDAVPHPKIAVAVGDCGCDGGIFDESYASLGGVGNVIPVEAHIHGCPPRPVDLLRGILTVIGR